MRSSLLHAVLLHQQATFRAYFSALGDQDLRAILEGDPGVLIEVLQCRYGYAASEAMAAWNDFVLRYVDGEEPSLAPESGCSAIEPWRPAASTASRRYERFRLH
jgi:hypothetical protein